MPKEFMNKPSHIGIIMDGNGRWAKLRNKPRSFGHIRGVRSVKKIVEKTAQLKIPFLTLYAFSSENWKRPKEEVSLLMKLLLKYLKSELKNLEKNNIKLSYIGDISNLPKKVKETLVTTCQRTEKNSALTLTLAINYGGRQEILNAVKRILSEKDIGNIDEKTFEGFLQSQSLPSPDLIIRTSGEQRLSNFLTWQSTYSELYFTDTLWPDFDEHSLEQALADFEHRSRRFGGLSKSISSNTKTYSPIISESFHAT